MEFNQSRREFLQQLAILGINILGLSGCISAMRKVEVVKESPAYDKSTVVIAQDAVPILGTVGQARQEKIQKMLDAAVSQATGAASVTAAWRKFFKPNDTVGIKVNCLRGAGKYLSSHPELVDCIVNGLVGAGVPQEQIIVWDRFNSELQNAGYEINRDSRGVKCFGTDAEGMGYSSELIISGSVASKISRILSTYCTAIINVPVLKDHNIAGVTLSLKNFFGAINDPNKYHDNINASVADLNASPMIKEKTKITVCDALKAIYDYGPGYHPRYTWDYNGLLVSTDPVAIDQIGATIIEKKREEAGLPSLAQVGRSPDYIAIAADAEHKLGTNDPEKIELVHLTM
jgi:uncharacterized protein (DUF362 family)